jgi:predicted nucleotidyltransferase
MIQKDYLNYLILKSKKLAKGKDILDIVLYGSIVKGKLDSRDVDIIIIFENKPLKERLNISQNFKNNLKKELELDIKTINLKELFEKDFLARQGVLIEGYSLLHNEKFSGRFGFKGYSIFTYNLMNLNHNEKTKFTYALIGRREEKGMLKQISASPLGKGAVKIPIENSIIFEDFLKRWKLTYKKEDILEVM